ncbi:MAG: hypothetical protein U0176_23245 [Bacteroidia bacterium]
MRASKEVLAEIKEFEPKAGNWLGLDALLNELWESGYQENFVGDLLGVFEKYPDEDGAGVFWSIVHGIESHGFYEKQLVESLKRQPSEMGLVLLLRIKNSGAKTVGGIGIDQVVADLISNERMSPRLRQQIIEIWG